MKSFLFFISIWVCNVSSAQDAMLLIQKVWQQQREIKSISYKLVRNDILVTGDRRQIKGEAYYNLSNSAIEFDIKRLDAQYELFQTLGSLLFVDHSRRQFRIIAQPATLDNLETQSAGQVFARDFFLLDTANAIAYELKDSSNYKVLIIRRSDIDEYDVRNRYKEIVIDTKLMLPVKIRLHQETAGKVQDLNYAFSNIKLNDDESLAVIRNTSVPRRVRTIRFESQCPGRTGSRNRSTCVPVN